MATPDVISDILTFCRKSIEMDFKRTLNLLPHNNVRLLKRNKLLNKGDFVGIVQNWKYKLRLRSNLESASSETSISHLETQIEHSHGIDEVPTKENILDLLAGYTFEALLPFKATVVQVSPDYDVYLKLGRTQIYAAGITQVLQDADRYGQCSMMNSSSRETCKGTGKACINVTCLSENLDWPGFSISHLRSLLLSEHVSSLLQANGFDVDYVKYPVSDKWEQCFLDTGITVDKYNMTLTASMESSRNVFRCKIRDALHTSRHLEKVSRNYPDFQTNAGDANVNTEATGSCCPTLINLRQFLVENHIDGCYDKNINLCDFSEVSDKLHDLTTLECHRQNTQQVYDYTVHIVPQEKSVYQQMVDIGWKIISMKNGNPMKQVHLVHGTVTSRGGQKTLFKAKDLISLRMKEMRRASFMKYGDIMEGPGWEDTIQALTIAGIKFEMLSTTCRQPVKLDLSEVDDTEFTMYSRGGVFVLYNCARLANLFSNLDKAVQKGVYPALPEIDSLDFSLLREDEEWSLMFNYILVYPCLVQECVAAIRDDSSKTLVHTHKVSQFLQELSKDLSSYYSRVHVLGEPREHLFPLMYCRIYLLKAVERVMHNALSLLNIQPLSQL